MVVFNWVFFAAAVDHSIVFEVFGEELVNIGKYVLVGGVEFFVRLTGNDAFLSDAVDFIRGDINF